MADNKIFIKKDSTDTVEKREDEMMKVIMSKIKKKMEEKMSRIAATLAGFLREEMSKGDLKDCEDGPSHSNFQKPLAQRGSDINRLKSVGSDNSKAHRAKRSNKASDWQQGPLSQEIQWFSPRRMRLSEAHRNRASTSSQCRSCRKCGRNDSQIWREDLSCSKLVVI
ncbi:hypothetical protein ElyMa_000671800 [Elysia marginata]|uniref:Uncharacterized protein n=1 Tax=Elysia marginata TaxID=1093978 RepID=A0AAV4GGR9_9GAST|nr:hypothetical protein ElyMa_000671800 [Elysia marginata]